MYPVKPTMIPKLEFSFVTSQEKFDIMTSVPEKTVVEMIGQQIKDNRSFRDHNTKIIFEDELNRLIFSPPQSPLSDETTIKQAFLGVLSS